MRGANWVITVAQNVTCFLNEMVFVEYIMILRNNIATEFALFITTVKKKETLIHTCVALGDGPLVSSWPRGREFDSCCHQSFFSLSKKIGCLYTDIENGVKQNNLYCDFYWVLAHNVKRSGNINFKTVFEFSTPTKQSWKICKGSQHFLFSFLDWLTQPQIKESISGITPCRERERERKSKKKDTERERAEERERRR